MSPSSTPSLPRRANSEGLRQRRIRSLARHRPVSRPKCLISISTPALVSLQARLRPISEGTRYCPTRLAFHPLSQVTRTVASTGCGPPCGFRHTSPCPGQDRRASGGVPVTRRAVNTSPLVTCGHIGFPAAPGREPLASPLKHTPRLVIRNARHNPACAFGP